MSKQSHTERYSKTKTWNPQQLNSAQLAAFIDTNTKIINAVTTKFANKYKTDLNIFTAHYALFTQSITDLIDLRLQYQNDNLSYHQLLTDEHYTDLLRQYAEHKKYLSDMGTYYHTSPTLLLIEGELKPYYTQYEQLSKNMIEFSDKQKSASKKIDMVKKASQELWPDLPMELRVVILEQSKDHALSLVNLIQLVPSATNRER